MEAGLLVRRAQLYIISGILVVSVAGGTWLRHAQEKPQPYGKNLVEKLSKEIVDGFSSASTHQKMLLFIDWISREISLGEGSPDPEETIRNRKGACGGISYLLLAFAKQEGLSGRVVNLYNYPKPGLGHTAVEIYWDGKWRYYDPTYGVYFVSNEADRYNWESPDVLSLNDLLNDPSLADRNRVVYPGRALLLSLQSPFVVAGSKEAREGLYVTSGVFQNANPVGPIGPEHPMIFPAVVDLSSGAVQIGRADGRNEDIIDLNGIPQGLHKIGADVWNTSHRYSFRGVAPGDKLYASIYLSYANREDLKLYARGNGVVVSKGSEFFSTDSADGGYWWRLELDVTWASPELLLTHDYTQPGHYVSVDAVEFQVLRKL